MKAMPVFLGQLLPCWFGRRCCSRNELQLSCLPMTLYLLFVWSSVLTEDVVNPMKSKKNV